MLITHSKLLTKLLILTLLLCLGAKLNAQNLSDSLFIKNFSSTNYFASSVNYSGITLSDNTILIANERGLLTFDGSKWELFPITNDAKVITLFDADSVVYVGGDDEFGYFTRNVNSGFEYTSLRNQVSDSIVWDKFFQIIPLNNIIYFQSYEQVFKWDGKTITTTPITDAHIFNVEDQLIASTYEKGFYKLKENDELDRISIKFIFEEDVAFSILKTSKPNIHLIFTADHGGYLLNTSNYSIIPWNTKVSELFKKDGFYYGTNWLDSLYAATTWDGGVVIFNEKGEIKKFIDKSTGITGKYLRELFIDNRNKIWITSDVGISEVYMPSYDTLSYVLTEIKEVFVDDMPLLINSEPDTCLNENTNLKFVFSSPGFESDEVSYAYKLDGLDKTWSNWTSENTKEYTQLKGGNYSFKLKAKTTNGLESSVISYPLNVNIPWYKTSWAYLFYMFGIIALVASITWARTLRLKILNNRLESIITNRTKEITEKSQALETANESLRVKNQELDNFVYRSSHDLIAPLKSLKGLIHIAKSDEPQSNQLEYLTHMEKSVLKLEDFIKSILDFATNIKTKTQKIEVNLDELLNDITYELKYYEHAKDIELKKNLGINAISTEPKRLKIILSNLLTNAVKYHNFKQTNPYIEVNSSMNGNNERIIEIIDNGQGIQEELLPNIFDMFFRANDSSEGSGLGLYIVKDMVERIDGTISVSSTYGKGTTFTLTFNP